MKVFKIFIPIIIIVFGAIMYFSPKVDQNPWTEIRIMGEVTAKNADSTYSVTYQAIRHGKVTKVLSEPVIINYKKPHQKSVAQFFRLYEPVYLKAESYPLNDITGIDEVLSRFLKDKNTYREIKLVLPLHGSGRIGIRPPLPPRKKYTPTTIPPAEN